MSRGPDPDALLPGILARQGRPVARGLSVLEAGGRAAASLVRRLHAEVGRARVVGITGPPGAGKSTLVDRLAQACRARGETVGILCVDPSSPFSGGALLGDRIRMQGLATDPGVFIRSMATRGALGGLARATRDAVDLLDAAGFDWVLVETVGVGQDEVDVVRTVDTVVVVTVPGLGDDIQAIKAGILEVADVHAVSKCDRPDANRTIADLKNMLALSAGPGTRYGVRLASKAGAAPGNDAAWRPPVIATSSVRGEGIDDLLAAVDRHFASLRETGELDARRTHIAERRMLAAGEDILRARFARHRDGRVFTLLDAVRTRRLSPHAAALRLLDELQPGGSE